VIVFFFFKQFNTLKKLIAKKNKDLIIYCLWLLCPIPLFAWSLFL